MQPTGIGDFYSGWQEQRIYAYPVNFGINNEFKNVSQMYQTAQDLLGMRLSTCFPRMMN